MALTAPDPARSKYRLDPILRNALRRYVRGMEETAHRDLVVGAVKIAESRLRAAPELSPFVITDRFGDELEEFEPADLGGAQARLSEFLHTAAGEDACALAYVSHTGRDEDAIVIEHGRAGQREAKVFVQRFRPRRGPLRGFKLLGDLIPAGEIER